MEMDRLAGKSKCGKGTDGKGKYGKGKDSKGKGKDASADCKRYKADVKAGKVRAVGAEDAASSVSTVAPRTVHLRLLRPPVLLRVVWQGLKRST